MNNAGIIIVPTEGIGCWIRIKKSKEMSRTKKLKIKRKQKQNRHRIGIKWFGAIHRLVAEHFIPNPDNKPQINHKDGNKHNNNINNLEWVTVSENRLHAWKNKLQTPDGLVKAKRKLSTMQVEEIRKRYEPRCKTNGTRALSREFNVSQAQISYIVNNKERIKHEHI